jgi:pyruvate/2-oxoglutarate dehydrogenase complex dihydrolipoamide acyltransferase (E2) component
VRERASRPLPKDGRAVASQEERYVAKVTMPQLGESVAEGTIGKWLKQPGDHVAKDEPLLEVITDKVNAEVPSPFEGILREILVAEGQTVPYNAEIAVIEESAGATPRGAGTAAAKAAAPGSAPGRTRGPATPATPRGGAAAHFLRHSAAAPRPRRCAGDGRRGPGREDDPGRSDADARARPLAVQIVGTGHAGRITRDDVMTFVAGPVARRPRGVEPPLPPIGPRGVEPPLRPTRPPSFRPPAGHPRLASRVIRRAWHRPRLQPRPVRRLGARPGRGLVPHTQMRRGSPPR